MKRQRGRSRRNNNQHNANRSMESNGPDVKVRGTAKQIFDKYESLARDAASSGNRVKAENFRQHAEHYLRIVNAIEAAKEKARVEAEAAKAESGENSSDSDDKDGGKDEGRSRRRYPPQVRKSSDEETAETAASNEDDNKSDETVSEPESSGDEKPAEAEKKSTRRRKAPSRSKSEPEDTATEAAE